nr:hypothetical protein [uncultured Massilia sp.]
MDEGFVLKQRELGNFPKKSPIGVYDRSMWCRECEKSYGGWDDIAIRVLRTPLDAFAENNFNYELDIGQEDLLALRLFFVSMLWRASTSTHHFYKRVSIGPHAKLAEKILRSNLFDDIEQFSTILTYSGFDEKIIPEPVPVKHEGVNYFRFFLGRFIAEIKVDQRPTPNKLALTVLGDSQNLRILKAKRDMKVVQSIASIAKAQLIKRS